MNDKRKKKIVKEGKTSYQCELLSNFKRTKSALGKMSGILQIDEKTFLVRCLLADLCGGDANQQQGEEVELKRRSYKNLRKTWTLLAPTSWESRKYQGT